MLLRWVTNLSHWLGTRMQEPLKPGRMKAATGPVLLYSPASNLEGSELEMLERAKVSIDLQLHR